MPRVKAKNPVSTDTILEKPKDVEKREAPDISMFKFEKKPHIKIEFESTSPKKNEQEESKGLWEPANWREFLINLRNMRANNDAPVDTMGCHKAMDDDAIPKVKRYQSLIALMLSSQTKDQVTFAAMERLRERGLTVDNVLSLSDEELGKLIYPVGFWKTKVKYIKKTTQTLKDQYDGDIPDSVEKLCKLTGVGPKMAHICMQVAWNKTTGIGVDTHVHRISNRIHWVKKPTATPEDTRKALQSWLPFDLWSEVNHLMVGFGQTICQPVNPLCHECLNNDICPSSGKVGRKSPSKKSPLKHNAPDIKQEIVSPVKEENLFPSPSKRKVTPKKNLTSELAEEVKDQTANIKSDPSAPTRKRKVTPKKELEAVPSKDVNITKLGTELSVHLSSDKKEVSPNNMNEEDNDMDVKSITMGQQKNAKSTKSRKNETEACVETLIINNTSNAADKLKKSPTKRKVPARDNNEPNTSSENDNKDTKGKTRANKNSVTIKASNPTIIEANSKQIKRKSPRNKS